MNFKRLFFIVSLIAPSICFSQMYSQNDIVSQFDPFSITINEMTVNTNDEDFREHPYIIIMTVTIGNEKITKFLYKDDITMNAVKDYDDFMNINFSARRNNILIFPSLVNLVNKPTTVTIRFEGYSNLYELDQPMLNQLSTSFCYVSSTMYTMMDQVYKFLAGTTETNRPNSSLLTTAEVLGQNISKRPEINYFGNPVEMTFVVPPDPKKVIGTDILSNGKKTIESKTTLRVNDQWVITITKLPDVKVVQAQPYYVKIKGVFIDLTTQQIISSDRREGNIAKAVNIINDELVPGKNPEVYINEQTSKQLSNLLNLIKAGVRAKSDTSETTNDLMLSDEREALSYFENNLRENEFSLENEYLYDDYINSSVNRGILQKEMDLIKRYYQIK
jgi:hypothetical protein